MDNQVKDKAARDYGQYVLRMAGVEKEQIEKLESYDAVIDYCRKEELTKEIEQIENYKKKI